MRCIKLNGEGLRWGAEPGSGGQEKGEMVVAGVGILESRKEANPSVELGHKILGVGYARELGVEWVIGKSRGEREFARKGDVVHSGNVSCKSREQLVALLKENIGVAGNDLDQQGNLVLELAVGVASSAEGALA